MHHVASPTNLSLSLDCTLVICHFFSPSVSFHTFFTIRRLIGGLGWNSAGTQTLISMKVSLPIIFVSVCLHVCVCVCEHAFEFVNVSVFPRLCVKINQAIRGLSVCAPLCGAVATDCADRLIHNLSIFSGSAIQREQDAELILMTGRACRCHVFISSTKFLMPEKCPPCFASYCQLVFFFFFYCFKAQVLHVTGYISATV